jgi:hypothetical protein
MSGLNRPGTEVGTQVAWSSIEILYLSKRKVPKGQIVSVLFQVGSATLSDGWCRWGNHGRSSSDRWAWGMRRRAVTCDREPDTGPGCSSLTSYAPSPDHHQQPAEVLVLVSRRSMLGEALQLDSFLRPSICKTSWNIQRSEPWQFVLRFVHRDWVHIGI